MSPAAGKVRSFMGSVGVINFDEGNIGECLIGPCEGEAPFGIPPGAAEFVVMERTHGQEIFFGGMVEDEQAFLGFIDADAPQLPRFFLGQIVAAENLFLEWIREAL
jgi:hypothetical protein